MLTYKSPGVYKEEKFLAPAPEFRTGVPVFLGLIKKQDVDAHTDRFSLRPLSTPGLWCVRKKPAEARTILPEMFTLWPEFEEGFGGLLPYGYLAYAVRGFFENGGRLCYVQVVSFDDNTSAATAVRAGLKTLEALDTIDLVCVPDIMWPQQQGEPPSEDEVLRMHTAALKHCETMGDRFAILDSLPGANLNRVLQQRQALRGTNGALYYPWVQVLGGPALTGGFVPPCGHVAGVYARSDQRVGVHKAPANEALEGVLDLEVNLTNAQQDNLNPASVNCLRAFPGRGIRVWGARTLGRDPAWTYINVRRLFLTAGRWIERNMAGEVFEPNDAKLWARIRRELIAYFNGLFRRGALKGRTAQDAFYVKCDEETNPLEVRALGQVVTEIGLAPVVPSEFIVVRIIHSTSGVTITTTPPTSTPTPAPPSLQRPVADAGAEVKVDFGASFTLDARASRAYERRRIVRYIWTMIA